MMGLVKPPRSVFVDFPLGHQVGRPFDISLQRAILRDALEWLEEAKIPGQIKDLPYEWGEPFDWNSYLKDIDEMIKEEGHSRQEWKPKK
jgi:hypothetical protein